MNESNELIVIDVDVLRQKVGDKAVMQLYNIINEMKIAKPNLYYVIPKNSYRRKAYDEMIKADKNVRIGTNHLLKKRTKDLKLDAIDKIEHKKILSYRDMVLNNILYDINKKIIEWKKDPIKPFMFLLSLEVYTKGECCEVFNRAIVENGLNDKSRYSSLVGSNKSVNCIVLKVIKK